MSPYEFVSRTIRAIALCIPTVHRFTRKMHGHPQRPPKSGFLLQKGKFSFIGAHMPNQPYNWVG